MSDTRVLDQFLKALRQSDIRARLGVLGGKDSRKEGDSNASIMSKHEFGEEGMPVRSVLRVPVIDHMQTYLDKSGAFNEEMLKEVIRKASIEKWVAQVGIVGEAIVKEAFRTGGFGKWQPSNMTHKKVKQTLVETQQMRNSVTSEVK